MSLSSAGIRKFLIICNPRTDKPIATVRAASAEDTDRAIQAAKQALVHPSWKLMPATERGQLMARLADLIEQNKDLLASIDAWDNGMYQKGCPVLVSAVSRSIFCSFFSH